MKMKKDEMPFRLRNFLPLFAHCKAKYWEQIEGMAAFIGKQPRTVEAYCSYHEDRMISADDYMRVAVEAIKRKSKSSLSPAFIIFDENGDQLFEAQKLCQAMFLADVEGAGWVATPRGVGQVKHVSTPAGRRSRLRRLVRDGTVQKHVIAAMFGFDQHCLVDYQLEDVDWLSTPDELRLHQLENFARAQMREAA